ncbi:metallophosphoesterase [Oceanobacillus halophilus]|uniref:Calcineurin-like phosphoesterase domain-containing protein n=1 Tax=Oceanobacillus halophilus TaxID=930130 RepID=A0A495A217_9BACI|nr:metallophosphoesterase [Oceanobacillus halophilus]RKQ33471.1 hypothetical protein D8M06_09685 [Oceanobacillus halophilus]
MKRITNLIVVLLILFVVYIYWDNNRLVIVEEDVGNVIMSEKFEGFKILQITDLHEKQFGSNQSKLINKINNLDYDAIVFTGDMLDNEKSTNYSSFYTLLDGIEDKENAWYVPGNTDPSSYEIGETVEKGEFIQGMEDRGVSLLETYDFIQVDEAKVYFTNLELSIVDNPNKINKVNGADYPKYADDERYITYQKTKLEELKSGLNEIQEEDVLIALNHYPIPDIRIDYIKNDPNLRWRDFDLILAGHYHGGQIRIPFYGALFIPDPWYTPNSFFPPQDRVKGLWEYAGTKQYVSTGLGSSDAISFLEFRLFNSPEINLIKLKTK